MALDHERKRIVDFVSNERERTLPEIRRLGRSSSSLTSYVDIATRFFKALDAHLASRLEQISTNIGVVSIDAASQRLNDVSKGVEAMISLIRTVAVSQSELPRELYGLVAWFFSKCSGVAQPSRSRPKFRQRRKDRSRRRLSRRGRRGNDATLQVDPKQRARRGRAAAHC